MDGMDGVFILPHLSPYGCWNGHQLPAIFFVVKDLIFLAKC